MLLDLFCLMDRFALKLRCAVRASGGCKRDLGLAERAGPGGGGFGRLLLVDARHSRVHHLDDQENDQSHDQEIDHRSDKFAVIQCDIARDIPRELVEVHAAEQTENRVDDVIYQRRDDAGKGAADDDTDSHVHHVSLADKLLEFLQKLF